MKIKVLLFLSILIKSSVVFAQNGNLAVVATAAGKVSGNVSADGTVHIFKGIPFAAPPVGNLRWKAPQPVTPWEGVKACTTFSASPVQAKPDEFGVYTREFLIPYQPISEDCLYLNVWTNATSSAEKKPVLVYIYGGGFGSGGAACPIYDGEATAKQGVVFVVINYRVGIFGFFAHPELSKESGHNASGNYGLMDQLAALKWVKQNIQNFGGDPGNVTIAGQSAGSMSVNCLVASPLGKGLFQKAIAESGASFINGEYGYKTLAEAEQTGVKLAKELNVNSIAALRNIPAADLLNKWQPRPIIDGYVLPESIAQIFAENKENNVPLLTGWNEDDAFIGKLKNAEDYKKQIAEQYGDKAAAFLQHYPGGTDLEAARSQINISRDQTFGIQNYTWANVQSAKQRAKVYLYRFARRLPATADFVKYGAFHTGEVAYAYNNLKFLNRPWEPIDWKLANTMSSYWTNFAKTGNPNGKGLPTWPAYNTGINKIMMLGEQPAAKSLPDRAALDFMVEIAGGK
ncbi:carboxylesterase/lipase family protein [Mucilaginibacter sp. FT3.2]|uniref:carboxylesterase/lipase family protein n=1 Tax=Mucilaginibacter sp. FT3.2 TaxID=2723090 RepID=UPI001616C8A9|nr:carboxylesterase family protein [Mucilaginibacter sp. FT3.2]MBB6233148.1 para-nitrobenzyl esterase [Mucilaginibacter sp. FT3.2]